MQRCARPLCTMPLRIPRIPSSHRDWRANVGDECGAVDDGAVHDGAVHDDAVHDGVHDRTTPSSSSSNDSHATERASRGSTRAVAP